MPQPIAGMVACWDCGAYARPPLPVVDVAPRCWHCNRRLGERFTRPWGLNCQRCGEANRSVAA